MKRYVIILSVMLMSITSANAQLNSFMADELKDFDNFMDQANKEFIEFLRQPWKTETPKDAEKQLKKPKIPTPPVAPGGNAPKKSPVASTPKKPADNKPKIDFGDKTKPIEAKQPGSVTPLDTKKPTEPKKPVATTPTKPADPAKPVATTPTKPAEPAKPVAVAPVPVKPSQPTAPASPLDAYKSQPIFGGGAGRVGVTFLGTKLFVSGDIKGKAHASQYTSDGIADAVESLASSNYRPLIQDINNARKCMKLNGWATVLLVNDIAKVLCSSENDQVIMRLFILNELGYKCQIGLRGSTPVLLLASDCMMYEMPYITIGTQKLFDIDKKLGTSSFSLPQKLSSKATKPVEMLLTNVPLLETTTKSSTHAASSLNTSVTAPVSNSEMELYKRYPHCDFSVYVKAPVRSTFSAPLLSAIRKLVEGKSEVDAVRAILSYCHYAFDYKTDDDQFGYEKPFFVEELFYYPYNDCEDRSIMFQYLVRNVLGLDVVLLDYPNHIATGVKFSSDVQGDKVLHNGTTYVVCDPTYIGADIGNAQPSFKNTKPDVLKY